MNKKLLKNLHRRERGSALAYTVMSALFLFFAIGLGVDLSHLYLAKTELQNAADAGALAGASALTLPYDNPERIGTAVNRALFVMNLNKYNFDNREYEDTMALEDQRDLVEFAVNLSGPYINEDAATANPENIRFIRVRTPGVPITTFFAIPILGASRTLDAVATAGLSVPGNVHVVCPLPLAAVECGADPNCGGMGGICNAGGPTPHPDGTPCDPDRELCKNCNYTIRAEPGEGVAPGNFQALCCGGDTCNNEWLRRAVAGSGNCVDCPPLNPGHEITPSTDTNPGQKQAAIRAGLNTRLDCYGPNANCGGGVPEGISPEDHPPDTNVYGRNSGESLTYSEYVSNNPSLDPTHPPQPNRRIFIVPITKKESWDNVEGQGTVEVGSLGAFFFKQRVPPGSGPDAGDVRAEYIGDQVIGAIGFDPNETTTTNVVTPVLYR